MSSVALKASADAFAIRRPRVAKLLRRAPRFRDLLAILGGAIPASVVGVVIFLTIYAWPAVTLNGWGFLSGSEWNLGNAYGDPILENGVSVLPGAHYAILFLIGGTLISTGIAMVVAVPVGVGAAIFLAEAVPNWARLWLSLFVELLAAIPSVVFGLWGYAVLIPMLGKHVAPAMTHWLGWIPFFGGSPGNGYGLLTAGLVLSLMIVPLITVTLRDAIVRQPDSLRETAAALGATCFETIWFVIMPGLRTVLIGACVLAIGRAMGETMAVLMVSGNALGALPPNIFGPVSTMASFIVSQLDSALADPTGFAIRSLAEIALALCLVHRCQHARSASPFLCRRRPVMSAASHVSEPRRRVAHDLALGRRRRLVSLLGWTLCAAGFVMLGVAMSWILGMILVSGISALSLRIFIEPTQGNGGGLLNAIEGTAVLAAGTLILAVPLGVAAGIYVAEFPRGPWAKTIRFFCDTLVGVPSIVLGYAGYVILVQALGWKFSGAAACVTLGIICLPYICRSSELAFAAISVDIRDAAYALGAGERQVILLVFLPAAMPGVLTGILLALSVSVGETAPLLYTAGWSNYLWNGQLVHSPIAYLTYAIWTFINEPLASANALAYAAALLVTSFVLLLSIASRLILRLR